jgi:hypothetical protein
MLKDFKRFSWLLLGLALLGSIAPASATVVIDFGTGLAGTGGTVTCLDATCTDVKGVGIPISSMTVNGAGGADGVYFVFGTASGTGLSNVGSLDFDTSLNTISITGGVCVNSTQCNGGGSTLVAATTLLSGTIGPSSFTLDGIGGAFLIASGPDTKSPALLEALGVPQTNFQFFGFQISVAGPTTPSKGATFAGISTDIKNTATVPEPASIVLFGSLITGLAAVVRRRKQGLAS